MKKQFKYCSSVVDDLGIKTSENSFFCINPQQIAMFFKFN